MRVKTADELHAVVKVILVAAGADEANADRVAEGLVSANLSGVDPHGVFHMQEYVEGIRDGFIVPAAKPEIITETPTTAMITGNWTFGFVTAKFALDLAVSKARAQSIAIVGMVRCGHIGRLGEYAEMAAADGMVSYTWAGGYSEDQQSTVPYGGRGKVLHTNPLSIGFPAGEETPMVMDFATTVGSGSKIMVARDRKERLPPGSIIDKHGNPSTDPEDFINGGAHLPFGGHKGYAIMLAVEFLGRILTGSDDYAEPHRGGHLQPPPGRHHDRPQGRPVSAAGALRKPGRRDGTPTESGASRDRLQGGPGAGRPGGADEGRKTAGRHPNPRRRLGVAVRAWRVAQRADRMKSGASPPTRPASRMPAQGGRTPSRGGSDGDSRARQHGFRDTTGGGQP